MTQISIESQMGIDTDPAVEIWHRIMEVPETFIRKLGDIVLGQE